MDTFTLLKFLTQFAMPPASMAVGLLLGGVLAMVGLRRFGMLVAALAIAQTLVMSFPPVADALLEPLQDKARAAAAQAPACCYDAIVVLGGGMTPAAPPFLMEPDLSDGADRIWYAAQLYHRGVAPTHHRERRLVRRAAGRAGDNRGRGDAPASSSILACRRRRSSPRAIR